MIRSLGNSLVFSLLASVALLRPASAQQVTSEPAAKPTEHVLGTITAIDSAAGTITVKDDKTGSEVVVSVKETRTLLKVAPGAKDLKSATRITAGDLSAADRVDVRGFKSETPPGSINARSVVLMSARDLQQKHQMETAAWENSIAGMVRSVDPASQSITITARGPEGPRPISVQTSAATDFTRYSPATPKSPVPSNLAAIQAGDQVRIIGQPSADGSTVKAEKVYSGAFRTVAGTVSAISADGKQITLKDLQTKQPVTVSLTAESSIRKLPPEMAMRLARRMNPAAAQQHPQQQDAVASAPPAGMQRPRNGDLSRLLQTVPEINASDLKSGDALVVSGVSEEDKAHLFATSVIAGVEPIFQSAPPREGQSLSSDWSIDMAIPAQ
jgi:Cu/Ag efflux protein CusF